MKTNHVFLFGKQNYRLVLLAIALLALGFLLMTGSSNDNAENFNADIFSFRRITLAPVVVLAGYVCVMLAIFCKPKQ